MSGFKKIGHRRGVRNKQHRDDTLGIVNNDEDHGTGAVLYSLLLLRLCSSIQR